jgi:hypothetical protein
MTSPAPLSSRIYRRMLAVYPEDLRREYGDEMAFVFAEQLREAHLAGALRVWSRALAEFLRFALPGWISSSAVRVPLFAIAFTIVTLSAAAAMRFAPRPIWALCAAILPTSNLPIIALVCMWRLRDRELAPLRLGRER